MNIAIMSHTKKQDLMVQFCTAYCGVLSKHSVCATNATGRMVADATGLPVHLEIWGSDVSHDWYWWGKELNLFAERVFG